MTKAEELREELSKNVPVTKKEFIDTISKRIKAYGKATFICDTHIGQTRIVHGSYIKPCDEIILRSWAISEGFRCSNGTNSFGVRNVTFYL